MTDDLKALAEAATDGVRWEVMKNGLGHDMHVETGTHDHPGPFRSDVGPTHECYKCRYIAAANPERILALIAENERLRAALIETKANLISPARVTLQQYLSAIDAALRTESTQSQCLDCQGSGREKYGEGTRTCYYCEGTGLRAKSTPEKPPERYPEDHFSRRIRPSGGPA